MFGKIRANKLLSFKLNGRPELSAYIEGFDGWNCENVSERNHFMFTNGIENCKVSMSKLLKVGCFLIFKFLCFQRGKNYHCKVSLMVFIEHKPSKNILNVGRKQ